MNQPIATHDKAKNELLTIEEKTGTELEELGAKHKKTAVNQNENDVIIRELQLFGC